MSEIKYAEEVRRGAALLDEKEPGWRDRISPADLQMGDCARCVVGQVRGLSENQEAGLAYDRQLRAWSIWETEEHYGFLPFRYDWDILRDAWIGYIKGEWS